jgi:DNA-binding MarR family transcriptional regulator
MSTKPTGTAGLDVTELPQQTLDALLGLFAAMRVHMRDSLSGNPQGLAPMHQRMLKFCMQHPGASQQALVQASGRDKGQVARLIKDLEAQGLLLREADPADGRSQRLKLTPAGRAACQRFRKHELAIAQRMFDTMSAHELQSLIDQLGAMRDRLRPTDQAPPTAGH